MKNIPSNTLSREDALNKILKLSDRISALGEGIFASNEAHTRIAIIDEVLKAIGWDTSDFNPETLAGHGYIDYLLKVENTPRLIVEAKRVGHTFGHPTINLQTEEYSLSYLRRAFGTRVSEVIDQATRYATNQEVSYACLTNGLEWILIQVIPPPGKKIDSMKGYYFGNLFAENSHFNLFWELMSKHAVGNGVLEENFNVLNEVATREFFIRRTEYGEFVWKKSKKPQFIREFYNRFFTDLQTPDRRAMLRRCFVSNSRLDQYQGELKRALRDTVPTFLPPETNSVSPSEGESLLLQESVEHSGRVILVTGSVGCGKSTLVSKILFETKDKEDLSNLIALKLDLIDDVSPIEGDITPQLFKLIREEWEEVQPNTNNIMHLRKYFGKEISALRESEYSDLYDIDEKLYKNHEAEKLAQLRKDNWKYFAKCWRYYKQKGIGILLILDNVDRASDPYQQQVYSFAHKLARKTGATIIVTMREFTFFKGQDTFLDVRPKDTILHLESPNFEQVISRRVKYILDHLDEDYRVKAWKKSSNWDDFRRNAISHAELLKTTFLHPGGREILAIFASISWHNVRYFLDLLRRIHYQLGSGGTAWRKRDVISTLMTTFSGSPAVITNIYKPTLANYPSYFLKLRLLLFLIYGIKESERRAGISSMRLVKFGRLYGYRTRWIEKSIEELVRERYLECLETPATEDFTKNYNYMHNHTFRASPFSIVLVKEIATHPLYLCLLGNDLPFHKVKDYDGYKFAINMTLDLLDNYEFERDIIDLLSETSLGIIVSSYLIAAFNSEQPQPNIAKIQSIAATETHLNQLVDRLTTQYAVKQAEAENEQLPPIPLQMSLFPREEVFPIYLTDVVPVPSRIVGLKVDGSEYVPLIFWSLVAYRALGKNFCSGSELTRMLNTYLLEEKNHKFPNNVSRALRTNTLQKQSWLTIDKTVHVIHNRFSLAEGWESYWVEMFSIPAPKF